MTAEPAKAAVTEAHKQLLRQIRALTSYGKLWCLGGDDATQLLATSEAKAVAAATEDLRERVALLESAKASWLAFQKERETVIGELREERDALRAENAALRETCAPFLDVIFVLPEHHKLRVARDKIEAVLKQPADFAAELADLRRDRERLDFLDSREWSFSLCERPRAQIMVNSKGTFAGETLRKAIDEAARATEGGAR